MRSSSRTLATIMRDNQQRIRANLSVQALRELYADHGERGCAELISSLDFLQQRVRERIQEITQEAECTCD